MILTFLNNKDNYMDGYTQIPFPGNGDIVYIIGVIHKSKFFPFYIGQSSRNIGRFGDYVSAKFSASTDFKVGEAVRYLMKKNYEVSIKYKESENKTMEESQLISNYKEKFPLLNDLKGYDYRKSDEEDERNKIHNFIDDYIRKVLCNDSGC